MDKSPIGTKAIEVVNIPSFQQTTSVGIYLKERPCPLCHSYERSRIFREAHIQQKNISGSSFGSRKNPEYMHYRLMECESCDTLYASPAPAERELASVYHEAAFESKNEENFAAQTYYDILSRLPWGNVPKHRLLDIGCGSGSFLAKAKKDFRETIGVEPTQSAINAAADHVRLDIKPGIFEEGQFAKDYFSAVCCFQTMEHLATPLQTATEMRKILKPGGFALIVAHNRRALSAKILGAKSPIFDIEHLQLFSPRSAYELLNRAGFEKIGILNIKNQYPLRYWILLLPFPKIFKEYLLRFLDKVGLGKLKIGIYAGNIAIYGQKPTRSDADRA